MVAMIRFAALLATLILLGVPSDASAYPAVLQDCWKGQAAGTTCKATPVEAATESAFLRWPPGSGWYNHNVTGCTGTGNSRTCNVYVCQNPSCTINYTFTDNPTNTPANSCPNGGTLSGNQCTCTAPKIDTGSACVDPPSCPAGQFKELSDGPCVEKCPLNQGNGAMEYPAPASKSASVCGQRVKLGGLGVMDYQGNEILCQYAGTGVTVCADMGQGTMCHSEMTYGLGLECNAENDVPPDTTPCSTGELYCDKGAGACPAGYTGGDFNGRSLCVKNGEEVNVVKRINSALDPPKEPPLPPAPPTIPNSETGGTDTNPEIFDSVVAVGAGANTTGGKGGTGEDIETCGLPNTPKCKIDETGTPTKGDFGDATKALNDAAKSREDGLATVTNPQGKYTSWAWTMALPTGCQPLSLNMLIKTVVFDPCAYQAVFHDLMSLLWAGATLFAVFGLVGRTLREA